MARIAGTASRHAGAGGPLSQEKQAEAVAELRELAAGRGDLLARWTDVAAPDPFVVVAAGRCPFTIDGLLAVADLVDRFRAGKRAPPATRSHSQPRARNLA